MTPIFCKVQHKYMIFFLILPHSKKRLNLIIVTRIASFNKLHDNRNDNAKTYQQYFETSQQYMKTCQQYIATAYHG